jgi:hypothetical protein
LGDKLVDWVNAPENERGASIGINLTPQNIDQHIKLQLKQLANWQHLNAGNTKLIVRLYCPIIIVTKKLLKLNM